jgi:hypothetical protein
MNFVPISATPMGPLACCAGMTFERVSFAMA